MPVSTSALRHKQKDLLRTLPECPILVYVVRSVDQSYISQTVHLLKTPLRLEPPSGIIVTQKRILIYTLQPIVSFSSIPAFILVLQDTP